MENSNSNSFRRQNLSHVKILAESSYRVVVPRLFLKVTGDWMLASMLAQLLFWSERAVRRDGFVYKSSNDWREEVGATDYEVRKFKKLPFIETIIKRANGSPTTHYRILAGVLLDCIHLVQQQDDENSLNEQDDSEQLDGSSEQSTAPFSTERPDESDETLTNITTNITTNVTNIKRLDPPENFIISELADQEVENDQPDTEKPPIEAENAGSTKEREAFKQFTQTLADITGYDISLKKTSSRVLIAARQLVQAGYTIADLQSFLPYWKEKDWRWQKNSQLPTPEDVLLNICRARDHKNRFRRWYS